MDKVSSRDRLEQCLSRIADPAGEGKRACLTIYAETARAAADAADARVRAGRSLGPLDGAIVSIKDLYDVAGEVTRAGSRVLAEEGLVAKSDALIVQRLRAAGAVIVAKTSMSEFAFSGVGANPHFGTPGNPFDRSRVPGGSRSQSVPIPEAQPEFPRHCAASSAGSRASGGCRPTAPFHCRSRSTRSGRWRGPLQIVR
jgi:aspartyl-tRNA(Asn)/glutamyl-tRNA(Gln) amidotransferase subunit A